MADRPATLDEVVAELQALQAAGHGACPVFYEYDCSYLPVYPDDSWGTVVAIEMTDDMPQRYREDTMDVGRLAVILGDNPCAGNT